MYTVYLKPTNKCNLKCAHCYHTIVNGKDTMNDDVLDRSINWINNLASKDHVNGQLHGGEPLLYPIDKLHRAVDSTPYVNWCITSNLVYNLNDDIISLFNKMKPFGDDRRFIQTSWDYLIRFKNKQQQLWEDNVKTIIDSGITVQPTICLTPVFLTNYTPGQIFEYLKQLGINRVEFERITNTGRAANGSFRPKNKDIDSWMSDAFDCYKQYDIEVTLFESIYHSLHGVFLGCRARNCTRTVFTINPDGSIAGCPNTADYAPNNIKTVKIYPSKLTSVEQQRSLGCYSCRFFEYCRGDCFQLQWDETGCPGLKSIYAKLVV